MHAGFLVCDETALKADLGLDLPQAAAGSFTRGEGVQASLGHHTYQVYFVLFLIFV